MHKFKSVNYSKIPDDDFIIRSKELLEMKKAIAYGSYLRYGKEKSCNLDLSEELEINNDNEIIDILKKYFQKLKKRKDEFILTEISFDITDESIKKLLDKLGNLNGLLQIENSNITENDVDNKLPKKMVNEIKKLINEYNDDKTIVTYVNLYMYLKNNVKPKFNLNEVIKGEKKFNGKKIKLTNYSLTIMHIDVIFENTQVSNHIYFKKKMIVDTKLWNVELDDILFESLNKSSKNRYQISYYALLKYFFHFIKKAYFNKLFEEKNIINSVIDTYNEIYDFREKIGEMNNNLCKIENIMTIDSKNKKIKEEYNIVKQEFETKCKHYFLQVSKPYYKYLKEYFKLI